MKHVLETFTSYRNIRHARCSCGHRLKWRNRQQLHEQHVRSL